MAYPCRAPDRRTRRMSSTRAPDGISALGIAFIGVVYRCLRRVVKKKRKLHELKLFLGTLPGRSVQQRSLFAEATSPTSGRKRHTFAAWTASTGHVYFTQIGHPHFAPTAPCR